jgi:hypothetical protein
VRRARLSRCSVNMSLRIANNWGRKDPERRAITKHLHHCRATLYPQHCSKSRHNIRGQTPWGFVHRGRIDNPSRSQHWTWWPFATLGNHALEHRVEGEPKVSVS